MNRFQNLQRVCLLLTLVAIFVTPNVLTPNLTRAEIPAPCALTWDLVASPDLGINRFAITAMDGHASDDIWIVGTIGDNLEQLLLEHWDGTVWSRVDAPDVGNNGATLYPTAVTVISPTDAWVVGSFGTESLSDRQAFAVHWDGTAWSPSAISLDSTNGSLLSSVSGVSGNDVWAIATEGAQTSIVHWNGTAWEKVPSPIQGDNSKVERVIAKAANDVWLVGTYMAPNPGGVNPYMYARTMHWDGTQWNFVADLQMDYFMGPPFQEEIWGFAAPGDNNVWLTLTGFGFSGYADMFHTRVMQWDGANWQTREYSGQGIWWPADLKGQSSTNVWVIPIDLYGSTADSRFIVRHWDGTNYNYDALPTPYGAPYLSGVAPISQDDVWIAGNGYLAHGHLPCAAPPATPKLAAPRKHAIISIHKAHLRWNEVPQTEYYEYEVSRNQPDSLWLSGYTTETRYLFSRIPRKGHTYYWRVRACNNAGCSNWSAQRHFTIRKDS